MNRARALLNISMRYREIIAEQTTRPASKTPAAKAADAARKRSDAAKKYQDTHHEHRQKPLDPLYIARIELRVGDHCDHRCEAQRDDPLPLVEFWNHGVASRSMSRTKC